MSSGQFVAFGGVADINLRSRTAAASGTHNMLCMLSGVILQPLIGYFLRLSSGGKIINGEYVYSTQDFHIALGVIPVCMCLAVLVVFFIREIYVVESKSLEPIPVKA